MNAGDYCAQMKRRYLWYSAIICAAICFCFYLIKSKKTKVLIDSDISSKVVAMEGLYPMKIYDDGGIRFSYPERFFLDEKESNGAMFKSDQREKVGFFLSPKSEIKYMRLRYSTGSFEDLVGKVSVIYKGDFIKNNREGYGFILKREYNKEGRTPTWCEEIELNYFPYYVHFYFDYITADREEFEKLSDMILASFHIDNFEGFKEE